MNIFYLSTDPREAAACHCDTHVVKMILETAQLLCSAHWVTGGEAPYKLTHRNHPCAVWVRESIANYRWTVMLGLALAEEYEARYGRVHKTRAVIEWCATHEPRLPNLTLTPPPLAMPEQYRGSDPVESYRQYYKNEKLRIARWNHGQKPEWLSL